MNPPPTSLPTTSLWVIPHAPAPSMLHPTSDMDWRFNSYMTVYMLEFPFEEIIVENFPNMEKEIVNQVQEAQRVPHRINPRRNLPRPMLIRLTKTNSKKEC